MFWKNFYNLCLKFGKSPNTVAKEIGISSGAITKWKNENVIPRESTLLKIADHFEITVDVLLSEQPQQIDRQEKPTADGSELDTDLKLIAALVAQLDEKQLPLVLSIAQDIPKLSYDQLRSVAEVIKNMVK